MFDERVYSEGTLFMKPAVLLIFLWYLCDDTNLSRDLEAQLCQDGRLRAKKASFSGRRGSVGSRGTTQVEDPWGKYYIHVYSHHNAEKRSSADHSCFKQIVSKFLANFKSYLEHWIWLENHQIQLWTMFWIMFLTTWFLASNEI